MVKGTLESALNENFNENQIKVLKLLIPALLNIPKTAGIYQLTVAANGALTWNAPA